MPKKNWCECADHKSQSFRKVVDLYSRQFIPDGWRFKYTTIAEEEPGRTLYLTGKCARCGGYMHSGTSIACNLTGDALFAYIYVQFKHFRPYDGQSPSGVYHGKVIPRAQWYWEQDRLTAEERKKQFVALFHEQDKPAARRWAEEQMPAPPVRRDTPSELFHAVIKLVQDNGLWPGQSTFYTITPSGPHEYPPSAVLTDYRFNFWPELNLGGDGGLYIDCVLYGAFDQSGRDRLHIGTIQTASADRDTCLMMGGLAGAMLYYAKTYLDANIHRYTPDGEFAASETI